MTNAICFIFSIACVFFDLLFSLPSRRNSDPGAHSRFYSPLLITVRALHAYREKSSESALSSLVDSRRIAPAHARRSQQLPWPIFYKRIFFCKTQVGFRRHWVVSQLRIPVSGKHFTPQTDQIDYNLDHLVPHLPL